MGDYSKDVYDEKKADLLLERDRVKVAPPINSIGVQRQRIKAIVSCLRCASKGTEQRRGNERDRHRHRRRWRRRRRA